MKRRSALVAVALVLAGCGSPGVPPAKQRRAGGGIPAALLAGVRPIGRGPRFQPPAGRRVLGACRAPLGPRREAHIEVFGANRVVLLATAIGTREPRRISDGRLTAARCFGAVVTLDPTGIVYFRPGHGFTVGDIFRAWGQPLGGRRIASFTGTPVRVYVNGRRWHGAPGSVPLRQHAEIVLELGPHVQPHTRFSFPPQPAASLR